MPDSALIGTPPTSYGDRLVYEVLAELYPGVLKKATAAQARNANPRSRSIGMVVGASFAVLLVLMITSARLCVRFYRSRSFGADDIFIIPAAVGCIAYLCLDIAQETAGCLGKHVYACTYEQFKWFYELAHHCFPVFYFTVFCVKISITLANRRITGMTSKKWQIAHWTYLVLLVFLMAICVMFNIFPCSPIATYFTLQSVAEVPDPTTIKCLNLNAISLATQICHIVTDWLLLPVPLIIIWQLQMPLSRKIRLMLVFCVGFISSLASIIRNVLTQELTSDVDVTYDTYTVYAWDIVDIFFATIVASLPALNGFLDQGIKKVRAMASGTSIGLLSWFRSTKSTNRSSRSDDAKLYDCKPGHSFQESQREDMCSVSSPQYEKPIQHQAVDIESNSPITEL